MPANWATNSHEIPMWLCCYGILVKNFVNISWKNSWVILCLTPYNCKLPLKVLIHFLLHTSFLHNFVGTPALILNLIFFYNRFCSHIKCPNEYLAYIIPTIHQRLADDEVVEPTEEIRLLLIESLSKLVDIYDQDIDTYIDELVQILQKTLVDPFGDVRKVILFSYCYFVVNNVNMIYSFCFYVL